MRVDRYEIAFLYVSHVGVVGSYGDITGQWLGLCIAILCDIRSQKVTLYHWLP